MQPLAEVELLGCRLMLAGRSWLLQGNVHLEGRVLGSLSLLWPLSKRTDSGLLARRPLLVVGHVLTVQQCVLLFGCGRRRSGSRLFLLLSLLLHLQLS